MQGKKFLFFLTDELGRSFYVENGLVQVSSQPRELTFAPGEWEDMLIDDVRNQKYFALDRNFTIPLNAVEDSALILKDQFYRIGIEAIVYLVILKQALFYDGTEYGYYYKSFYKGEVDLTNFNHTGPIVNMQVMEGGLAKLIKAKENITYEIPLDTPGYELILMDGIILKEGVNYSSASVDLKKSDFGSYFIPPLIHISSDSSLNPGVLFNSPNIESMTSSPFNYLRTSPNSLAKANPDNVSPVILNITGQIIYQVKRNDGALGIRLRFFKRSQTAANQNVYLLPTVPAGGSTVGVTYTANVNLAISLAPGEDLFFYVEYIGTTGAMDTVIAFLPTTNLRINYDFKFKQTLIKALPPLIVFKELIRLITDGKYTAQSNLLTAFDNLKLTSGDGIRGFDKAVLKTNLSDFFKAYDVHLDAGMGSISGILRLENKSFFVDYASPIQMGEVSKLSIHPAKDYIYNTIITGQRDVTYDNVNGKQEFQGRVQWSTPITRVTKELDRMSPYRQDSYGIEFIRINLEGKTTTDNSGDSDVFMICTEKIKFATSLEGQNLYYLDRSLNPTATGLIETTTPFNLWLSPARMLHRSGRYVHSLFYRLDGKQIVFQTTDKNKELVSGGIVEKGSVGIGGLGKEYFLPIEFTFECPAPEDLIEILDLTPVRPFQFSYLGLTFLMLPLKSGVKAGNNEVQTYSGLCWPDADLTQLINIFD
jgi:hypothetical protein